MKASQVVHFLLAAFTARQPAILVGGPGCAKTSLVEQVAKMLGLDIMVSHPVVNNPTDYKGLPWVSKDKKSATWLPFGDLDRALNATEPLVWFLDDLGQAPASVQAAAMQLLLARRINGHKIPDCVTFAAATNRRSDRAGVSGMLEPVKSRFASIIEVEADVEEWCDWAIGADIHPIVMAAIDDRYVPLNDFQPTADMTNSPTPRTWEFVSKMLSWTVDGEPMWEDVLAEAIQGAVGTAEAAKFMAFRKTHAQLPSANAMLADPEAHDVANESPSVLYALTAALARKATASNLSSICRIAERCLEGGRGEFGSLSVRFTLTCDPTLAETPEYAALNTGPVGALMHGDHIK